jgi:hypothetical protein
VNQPDRELESYLAGDSPLSRRYRAASRETPPSELDAAVLAAARAAVVHAPRRRARWQLPLAAAATVVLGVSLVSQLRFDAVPEAVRADRAEVQVAQQAPADVVRREADAPGVLSMESISEEYASDSGVADMVAPSAPAPAAAPPAARKSTPVEPQARPEAEAQALSESAQRQEQTLRAERESVQRRERSAPAGARSAAPPAAAFAMPPAPPAATLDQIAAAARELLLLLQSQDLDALAARAPAGSPRSALDAVAARFRNAHAAQVFAPNDGRFRVIFTDVDTRTLGSADLKLVAQGWQLLALEPAR